MLLHAATDYKPEVVCGQVLGACVEWCPRKKRALLFDFGIAHGAMVDEFVE